MPLPTADRMPRPCRAVVAAVLAVLAACLLPLCPAGPAGQLADDGAGLMRSVRTDTGAEYCAASAVAAPRGAPGADPDQPSVPAARRAASHAGKPRTAAPHRNVVAVLRPVADAPALSSARGRLTPPGPGGAPTDLRVVLRC